MSSVLQKEKLWTPANVVTLLRICLIPLFVVALLSPWPTWFFPDWPELSYWKEWIAAAIFILLAASDALDGYLARSRGEVTNFGKFMDPLADKILVAAALLALVELNVLPSWVALVILCREFIVSGIRMVAAAQGIVIAASGYGKAKTVSQIIAIVLFIIKDSHMVSDFSVVLSDRLYLFSWVMMIIALILTIVSMLDYFAKAKTILGFKSETTSVFEPNQKVFFSDANAATSPIGENLESIQSLAAKVVASARGKELSLGTAESCTGGMISTALTSIPGSSDAVKGAVVSYSNEIKHDKLGVSNEMLHRFGAVSEEVALAMAQGARKELNVSVALSVTGIAGPEGGSDDKPVGTVWIGLSDERLSFARLFHFEGERGEIREQATRAALEILINHLN